MSKRNAIKPDQSFGFGIASLAQAILPQTHELNLEGATVAQLQTVSRDIVSVASVAFGKVVILVDDVDMLPSDLFHEVIRVLRPFSKVKNVSCVIAAPEYFYLAFHTDALNDLHSTLREIMLIGDPRIHQPEFPFKPKRAKKIEIQKMLVDLLCSRCRLTITDPGRDPTESYLFTKVFNLDDWKSFTNAAGTMMKSGWGTRREWIRELAAISGSGEPFKLKHSQTVTMIKEDMTRKRNEFGKQETILEPEKVEQEKVTPEKNGPKPNSTSDKNGTNDEQTNEENGTE